jgi:hypothetical protein
LALRTSSSIARAWRPPQFRGPALRLQPLQRVGTQRLQQAVARRVFGADADQRALDQHGEAIDDFPSGLRGLASHRHHLVQREAACEHTQCTEQLLVLGAQQTDAPVQRRQQAVVPRRAVATAVAQQRKALVHGVQHTLQTQQRYPRRRHLQRQWQPIEPGAQMAHLGQGMAIERSA